LSIKKQGSKFKRWRPGDQLEGAVTFVPAARKMELGREEEKF